MKKPSYRFWIKIAYNLRLLCFWIRFDYKIQFTLVQCKGFIYYISYGHLRYLRLYLLWEGSLLQSLSFRFIRFNIYHWTWNNWWLIKQSRLKIESFLGFRWENRILLTIWAFLRFLFIDTPTLFELVVTLFHSQEIKDKVLTTVQWGFLLATFQCLFKNRTLRGTLVLKWLHSGRILRLKEYRCVKHPRELLSCSYILMLFSLNSRFT